ncbi:MAG TPA: sugar ABC transporter permease [Spirochaetia bacterium]|nr:sugar ABC transporter permease [Spirochaetia bacterium]
MTRAINRIYSFWFLVPGGIIYFLFFLLPTFVSFYFSMTRWTIFNSTFTGLDNFRMFFSETSLNIGFRNTLIYAVVTCGLKVIVGFLLGAFLSGNFKSRGFLRSMVFFPTILSTIAVGIIFSNMMHPTMGAINVALAGIGIQGPDWLGNVHIALLSVAMVDVWKGVGIATVIYLAGIQAIPQQYYEAVMIDGGSAYHRLRHVTLPLSRPAMNAVIVLAFIGGLRTFDLIWVMTGGGPGFTTDLIASIIYKQYQAGFWGLATAGNVILFFIVAVLAVPLFRFLQKSEVGL